MEPKVTLGDLELLSFVALFLDQLKVIRSVTLASVICSVLDIGEIQRDVFEIPHKG